VTAASSEVARRFETASCRRRASSERSSGRSVVSGTTRFYPSRRALRVFDPAIGQTRWLDATQEPGRR
jgi:hypothetical protein